MKDCPKISIVTPSYNQGKFIKQTIESILDQGYPNLEYFVFDGGSRDETVQILQKYSPYLSYWESVPDRGQSHAINKGIERSSGQIFNWINSDDYAEPGALKNVAEAWMSAEAPPAAICGYAHIWDIDAFSHKRRPSHVYAHTEESVAFFNINQEGTYFNLAEVKALGGVDERFHYAMDLELWLNLHLKFPSNQFIQIDAVLGNFRRHMEAKSTIQNTLNLQESAMIHEEMLVFDAMLKRQGLHSKTNASCLGLPEPFQYSLRQPEIQNLDWIKIQQDYVIKWAKRLFEKGMKKEVLGILKNLPNHSDAQSKRDAFYLRRKVRFPFL
jgi:hypothetical protein